MMTELAAVEYHSPRNKDFIRQGVMEHGQA